MYCTLYNKQKITDWWCGHGLQTGQTGWLHLTAAAAARTKMPGKKITGFQVEK